MLILALRLMADGTIAAVTRLIFVCENLLALACAVEFWQIALGSGGGWPDAAVAAALAFVGMSAVLRIAVLTVRPLRWRLALSAVAVIPAAIVVFRLSEAVLRPFVPLAPWRAAISLLIAIIIANRICWALWAYTPVA